jgi:hypothetical protein
LANKKKLTAEEAEEYVSLGLANARRWWAKKAESLPLNNIGSKQERSSALTPSTVARIYKDSTKGEELFLAMSEAVLGSAYNAETVIDKILNGENAEVSAVELYDAFKKTRVALRKQFGDNITLYRARTKQKAKRTTNWVTTPELASKFGDDIITKKVPIDMVVAAFVGTNGKYEEIIVGKPPTPALEPSALIIEKSADFSYTQEYRVIYPNSRRVRIKRDTTKDGWVVYDHPRGATRDPLSLSGTKPVIIGRSMDQARQWLADNPISETQGTEAPRGIQQKYDEKFTEAEQAALEKARTKARLLTDPITVNIVLEGKSAEAQLQGQKLVTVINKQALFLKKLKALRKCLTR